MHSAWLLLERVRLVVLVMLFSIRLIAWVDGLHIQM